MTHYRAAQPLVSPLRRRWPSAQRAERLAWVAAAAVATAVSAQVSVTLPGMPVPFTLQPVAVMVAGVVLGARLGAASQVAYLVMGVAGASAFAWSPVLLPGVGRLLGPTGGFLLAFPLAAYVTGALSTSSAGAQPSGRAVAMIAGATVLHLVGWAWAFTVAPAGTTMGMVAPYVVADLVKMLLAAPMASRLSRLGSH